MRPEHLAAIEHQKQVVAACLTGRGPIIDVLVGAAVVAQARTASRGDREGVGRTARKRAARDALASDGLDGRERADEGAGGIPQLPLEGVGPPRFAGVDGGWIGHRRQKAAKGVRKPRERQKIEHITLHARLRATPRRVRGATP